jgi:hypothetical protein
VSPLSHGITKMGIPPHSPLFEGVVGRQCSKK